MGTFSVRKTQEEFEQDVYRLVKNEYKVTGKYVGANVKIQMLHNKCGNKYMVKPNAFLNGIRCPICAGLRRKTQAWFVEKVNELTGDEYTVIGKYINMGTKVKILHNKCGNVYEVTPTHFIHSGSRCTFCSGRHHYTDDEFKALVFSKVGDEYTFLEPYVNNRTKTKVVHNLCGLVYSVKPNDFLFGKRCPYCCSPHGELHIRNWLIKHKITFEEQKKFDSLRDSKLLSYDFFIPSKRVLIEFQGAQHFISVDYFGGIEGLNKQKRHDKLKSEFAKKNNLLLLQPTYKLDTQEKVSEYLNKKLG